MNIRESIFLSCEGYGSGIKVEQHLKAQLAYSFDLALQNEFSMEENIAPARQFLLDGGMQNSMMLFILPFFAIYGNRIIEMLKKYPLFHCILTINIVKYPCTRYAESD